METINRFSPQQKMMGVNDKFGQKNITRQQGSTRDLYDSIEFKNGVTEMEFFRESGTRQFPFTDLTTNGNLLQAGESFCIQYIYFNSLIKDTELDVCDPKSYKLSNIATCLDYSQFEIFIGNTRVIKPIRLMSMNDTFARQNLCVSNVFAFETYLIIPPLVEFTCRLTIPTFTFVPTATKKYYIQCTFGGMAAILSPKGTF